MNKKGVLKSGLHYDAIYGRDIYCYVKNNSSIVRYAKNQLCRSLRREGKEYIRRRFYED